MVTLNFDKVFELGVQALLLFAGYYLGLQSRDKEFERNTAKKRYETAYVPFMDMLYRGFMFNGISQDIPPSLRAKFLDIFSKNLSLWGEDTLKAYPAFYKSFLDMLEYDDGNPEYQSAPDTFRKNLSFMALTILEDAEALSKGLGLPSIAKPLLENYRHNCHRP